MSPAAGDCLIALCAPSIGRAVAQLRGVETRRGCLRSLAARAGALTFSRRRNCRPVTLRRATRVIGRARIIGRSRSLAGTRRRSLTKARHDGDVWTIRLTTRLHPDGLDFDGGRGWGDTVTAWSPVPPAGGQHRGIITRHCDHRRGQGDQEHGQSQRGPDSDCVRGRPTHACVAPCCVARVRLPSSPLSWCRAVPTLASTPLTRAGGGGFGAERMEPSPHPRRTKGHEKRVKEGG